MLPDELPIQRLMSEHRLIEKMVNLVQKENERIEASGRVDANFIVNAVDFFRTYADKYHHGKEEGILFKGLSKKKLTESDYNMMLVLTKRTRVREKNCE